MIQKLYRIETRIDGKALPIPPNFLVPESEDDIREYMTNLLASEIIELVMQWSENRDDWFDLYTIKGKAELDILFRA